MNPPDNHSYHLKPCFVWGSHKRISLLLYIPILTRALKRTDFVFLGSSALLGKSKLRRNWRALYRAKEVQISGLLQCKHQPPLCCLREKRVWSLGVTGPALGDRKGAWIAHKSKSSSERRQPPRLQASQLPNCHFVVRLNRRPHVTTTTKLI